jgi:hypothetical protein
MKIVWDRVTWYSKLLAVIVFLATFAIAFYLGRAYQAGDQRIILPRMNERACTLEGKICPDGSVVGRTGPRCEFAECPAVSAEPAAGKFCGGIAAIPCASGYRCEIKETYPDAGGSCVKD